MNYEAYELQLIGRYLLVNNTTNQLCVRAIRNEEIMETEAAAFLFQWLPRVLLGVSVCLCVCVCVCACV